MKYGTIYADPPWSFKVYSPKGKGRSAEAWYETMDLGDIRNLDVPGLAAENSVLFLWVTDPFLREAFSVIDAWGFKYKTVGFYWAKTNQAAKSGEWEELPCGECGELPLQFPIGTGYWTRANPEQCLLATRGKPHRLNADVRKLIVSPRREHSRKPDETYERIERLCPGPYVELFARQRVPGWDTAFSNEAESGPTLERKWKSTAEPAEPADELGI